ncbi:MAG: class I SAM-dependent methyltransferase [Planctomycetes bacterium]|nr:class I SAM-dependent methyltransferase [Planctomycetota bacterium]
MQLWTRAFVALPLVAVALACRSGPHQDEAPHAFGDVRSEGRTSTLEAAQSAPAAHAAEPARAKPANRDPKGQPDVDRYIALLESAERQKELKVDLVIAKLELPRDAAVGDLGCGPGLFTLALAVACPDGVVFASDIEPAQIDRVRERVEERGLRNVVPVLASTNDPRFPRQALDLVFVADTYHHLEDRIAYFKQLKDVLRPGGRLAIVEYKPGKLPVGPPPDHKLPDGLMDRELERAGWVLIDRFNTHAYHEFEVWRPRKPWESPAGD